MLPNSLNNMLIITHILYQSQCFGYELVLKVKNVI